MTKSSSGRPAPVGLRRALASGSGDVDYVALMHWWEHYCPDRLKRLAPDTAALLSAVPEGAFPLPIEWRS